MLDAVVIYRAYVVWQSVYIILFPVVMWLGLLACYFATNIALVQAKSHADNIFTQQTGHLITANYAMTLATNLLATGLLAYRIWVVSKNSARYRASDTLTPVLRAVIESGAIYSAMMTAGLVTFVIDSPGVYIILDMIPPVTAIVFYMIIVTVGLNSVKKLSTTTVNTGPSVVDTDRRAGKDRYEMSTLRVEVSEQVETDSETMYRSTKSDPKYAV